MTKNVEPHTVAGGNPAVTIKKRFDEELIALLLELRWWDFEPEELVQFLPILCDRDLASVKITLKKRVDN